MRKYFFITVLLLILSGCGDEYVRFTGESESWKGEYTAYIGDARENGEYKFFYKEGKSHTVFKNFEVNINDGESITREETRNERTIIVKTNCKGCAVISKDDKIKILIKWNGKEETFYLKSGNKK
ncbi:MAG TPA: membrane lipoprotein lipid attachment site-containing protein [Bacillaceae bacterium]